MIIAAGGAEVADCGTESNAGLPTAPVATFRLLQEVIGEDGFKLPPLGSYGLAIYDIDWSGDGAPAVLCPSPEWPARIRLNDVRFGSATAGTANGSGPTYPSVLLDAVK